MIDIPNNNPLEKTDFSLSQWVSIPNSFLVKSGTLCLLPLLTAGPENAVTVSVSSDVHQSCAVWGHPPTSLLKSFCHHRPWYRSLSLEGRGLIKILHLGMSASKLLTLGILSGVNFFGDCHLLQVTSLMRAEWCSAPWL